MTTPAEQRAILFQQISDEDTIDVEREIDGEPYVRELADKAIARFSDPDVLADILFDDLGFTGKSVNEQTAVFVAIRGAIDDMLDETFQNAESTTTKPALWKRHLAWFTKSPFPR